MNVKEYASLEFLKFKYRRGEDKVIQSLCRIGPPPPPLQKLVHLSLVCRNFENLRKVLPDQPEYTAMEWVTENLDS